VVIGQQDGSGAHARCEVLVVGQSPADGYGEAQPSLGPWRRGSRAGAVEARRSAAAGLRS